MGISAQRLSESQRSTAPFVFRELIRDQRIVFENEPSMLHAFTRLEETLRKTPDQSFLAFVSWLDTQRPGPGVVMQTMDGERISMMTGSKI